MSDLQSQVNLLNDYIRTLQRQTQSKSNEIRTLTQQNTHLIQECESLRSNKQRLPANLASSTSSVILQSTITKLQNQLSQSKTAYTLLLEKSPQQAGNTQETQRLRDDVRRLTQEKLILQQYKEKLEKDLREMGFKSVDSWVGRVKEFQVTIEESTRKVKGYQTRVVDYQRKVTLLSNQITIKNSQIERLNDKVKTLTDTRSTVSSNGNAHYESKITQYQTKLTHLTTQLTITRSEIQRLQQKQTQLLTLQRQTDNYKRQIQSLNLKITSLSSNSVQVNSYQTTINTLRNEKNQWERERQQLNGRIADLQAEIVEKSNAIAQLRLREEFLKSKEITEGAKDKDIENLNSIIRGLRIENDDHKRTITFRDSTIKGLQTKLTSLQYSKSTQTSTIQRIVQEKNQQITRIIESHNQKVTQLSLQIEKYRSLSIVNSQSANEISSLREQNTFLKRQSQNNQILVQELQREKENLKIRIRELEEQLVRNRVNGNEVRTFVTKNDGSETELTRIVRELRGELEEVKRSNGVIHEENYKMQQYLTELTQSQMQIPYFGNQSSIVRYHSPQNATSFHQQIISSPSQLLLQNNDPFMRKSKHYQQQQQPYFKSQMNIDKKRQQRMDRSVVSPTRDVAQNQQPSLNNRQKWESLQRKISALRVENDSLKRTLLYE